MQWEAPHAADAWLESGGAASDYNDGVAMDTDISSWVLKLTARGKILTHLVHAAAIVAPGIPE